MTKLLSASLLVLGAMSAVPAYADLPEGEFLGMVRDTSDASDWQMKWLGGTPADGYDWKTPLADSAIPYRETEQYGDGDYLWVKGIPWIGPSYISSGDYFAYETVITDDFSLLGSDQSAVFDGLSIKYSADDYLIAIVINGIQYDGFDRSSGGSEHYSFFNVDISGIDYWNVGTSNTIVLIVHDVRGRPTGLAASMQATYLVTNTPVPEPETYAMLLAGLGVVGAVARRRKISVN